MSQLTHELEATIDAALERYPRKPLPFNFTHNVMTQIEPRSAWYTLRMPNALLPYRMELALALLLTLCFALVGVLVMIGAQMSDGGAQSVVYRFVMSSSAAQWTPWFACLILGELALCIYLWQKWTTPTKYS